MLKRKSQNNSNQNYDRKVIFYDGFFLERSIHYGDISPYRKAVKNFFSFVLNLTIELQQCLFFDTETTGLSGGAGTYPFIYAFGYIDNDAFIIDQVFLDDISKESALIVFCNDLVKKFLFCICFNGKSFDIPLYYSRNIINRINPLFFNDFTVVDIYHILRMLFRSCLHPYNLKAFELFLVQYAREDDIPSSLIPYLYKQYLYSNDIKALSCVFEHNYNDVYSMLVFMEAALNKIELAQYDVKSFIRYLYGKKRFSDIISVADSFITNENDEALLLYIRSCKRLKRHDLLEKAFLANGFLKSHDISKEYLLYMEYVKKDYQKLMETCLFLINIVDEPFKKDVEKRYERASKRICRQ